METLQIQQQAALDELESTGAASVFWLFEIKWPGAGTKFYSQRASFQIDKTTTTTKTLPSVESWTDIGHFLDATREAAPAAGGFSITFENPPGEANRIESLITDEESILGVEVNAYSFLAPITGAVVASHWQNNPVGRFRIVGYSPTTTTLTINCEDYWLQAGRKIKADLTVALDDFSGATESSLGQPIAEILGTVQDCPIYLITKGERGNLTGAHGAEDTTLVFIDTDISTRFGSSGTVIVGSEEMTFTGSTTTTLTGITRAVNNTQAADYQHGTEVRLKLAAYDFLVMRYPMQAFSSGGTEKLRINGRLIDNADWALVTDTISIPGESLQLVRVDTSTSAKYNAAFISSAPAGSTQLFGLDGPDDGMSWAIGGGNGALNPLAAVDVTIDDDDDDAHVTFAVVDEDNNPLELDATDAAGLANRTSQIVRAYLEVDYEVIMRNSGSGTTDYPSPVPQLRLTGDNITGAAPGTAVKDLEPPPDEDVETILDDSTTLFDLTAGSLETLRTFAVVFKTGSNDISIDSANFQSPGSGNGNIREFPAYFGASNGSTPVLDSTDTSLSASGNPSNFTSGGAGVVNAIQVDTEFRISDDGTLPAVMDVAGMAFTMAATRTFSSSLVFLVAIKIEKGSEGQIVYFTAGFLGNESKALTVQFGTFYGTATGSDNDTNLSDTTANWIENEWNGHTIVLRPGESDEETRTVTDNDSNDITIGSAWLTGDPQAGDDYILKKSFSRAEILAAILEVNVNIDGMTTGDNLTSLVADHFLTMTELRASSFDRAVFVGENTELDGLTPSNRLLKRWDITNYVNDTDGDGGTSGWAWFDQTKAELLFTDSDNSTKILVYHLRYLVEEIPVASTLVHEDDIVATVNVAGKDNDYGSGSPEGIEDLIRTLIESPDYMGLAQPASTVDSDSAAAQSVLNVAATTGFTVGKRVTIAHQTPARREELVIASIQAGVSLTFEGNLAFAHTAAQADTVVQTEFLDLSSLFDAAADVLAEDVGYIMARRLAGPMPCSDILFSAGRDAGFSLVWDKGRFRAIPEPIRDTSVAADVLIGRDDLPNGEIPKSHTGVQNIINSLRLYYARSQTANSTGALPLSGVVTANDGPSQALQWGTRPGVYQSEWIRRSAGAQVLADRFVRKLADPRLNVPLTVELGQAKRLNLGDSIDITEPDSLLDSTKAIIIGMATAGRDAVALTASFSQATNRIWEYLAGPTDSNGEPSTYITISQGRMNFFIAGQRIAWLDDQARLKLRGGVRLFSFTESAIDRTNTPTDSTLGQIEWDSNASGSWSTDHSEWNDAIAIAVQNNSQSFYTYVARLNASGLLTERVLSRGKNIAGGPLPTSITWAQADNWRPFLFETSDVDGALGLPSSGHGEEYTVDKRAIHMQIINDGSDLGIFLIKGVSTNAFT